MEEIFEFIASNPATILIAAGVLFLFTSLCSELMDVGISQSASDIGFLLIGLGAVLHILWLFAKDRE
ncbi:MAG: hypothetical protein ABSB40_07200 [Nitrososphaeria archaeon]